MRHFSLENDFAYFHHITLTTDKLMISVKFYNASTIVISTFAKSNVRKFSSL